MAENDLPSNREDSETPTLDTLPRPPVVEILRHCPPDTLRQLRLVNQHLKKAVDEHITSLDFYSGGATRYMDSLHVLGSWQRWPNLRRLKLCFQKPLQKLPEDTPSMADQALLAVKDVDWPMEELSVSSCGLTPIGAMALGKLMCRWSTLRRLDLSYNKLMGDIGIAVLERHEYPCLEYLELSGIKLGGGQFTNIALARITLKCPKLRHFKLADNDLTADDIEDMVFMGNLSCLETLDLIGNALGSSCGTLLANASSRWPHVRTLLLSFNKLDDEEVEHLCEAQWSLEKLDLNHNHLLGVRAATALCQASFRSPCLASLTLSGNDLNMEALEVLLQGEWPKLERISLFSNSQLWPDGAGVLAANADRLPSLKEFRVDNLGPDGWFQLMQASWNNLEVLYCSGLHAPPGLLGITALVDALEQGRLPSLKELHLPYSHLDAIKLKILFRCTWPKLKKLDLGYSLFGNRGAVAIGLAAEHLPSLVDLKIEECGLGTKGLAYLVNAGWKSLKEIMLSPIRGSKGFPDLPKRAKSEWELENRWEIQGLVKRKGM